MSALCARYGVSRAGYYAWRGHKPGVRHEQDRRLLNRIQAVYASSDGTYGSPRICGVLKTAGILVGRQRVARLMREGGYTGACHGALPPQPGYPCLLR